MQMQSPTRTASKFNCFHLLAFARAYFLSLLAFARICLPLHCLLLTFAGICVPLLAFLAFCCLCYALLLALLAFACIFLHLHACCCICLYFLSTFPGIAFISCSILFVVLLACSIWWTGWIQKHSRKFVFRSRICLLAS